MYYVKISKERVYFFSFSGKGSNIHKLPNNAGLMRGGVCWTGLFLQLVGNKQIARRHFGSSLSS